MTNIPPSLRASKRRYGGDTSANAPRSGCSLLEYTTGCQDIRSWNNHDTTSQHPHRLRISKLALCSPGAESSWRPVIRTFCPACPAKCISSPQARFIRPAITPHQPFLRSPAYTGSFCHQSAGARRRGREEYLNSFDETDAGSDVSWKRTVQKQRTYLIQELSLDSLGVRITMRESRASLRRGRRTSKARYRMIRRMRIHGGSV
jgi:hypothetical protein